MNNEETYIQMLERHEKEIRDRKDKNVDKG